MSFLNLFWILLAASGFSLVIRLLFRGKETVDTRSIGQVSASGARSQAKT
ncbi:MAG: hypothetical protein R2940_13510 [Syntrophotaleaceae bacterium]